MARAYLVFGDIEGRLEMLRVECTRCQRKGRYSVLKLIQQYGPCADIATNPRNSFNFFVTATPQGRARLARSSIIHGTAADRGRVVGIDITPAMVAKAETATKYLGLTNVHVHVGDIAALPMENASVDVVISNGAINLSSRKSCVFREVFRVLRPGGRFQFADMVRDGATDAVSCGSWADCVSGTVDAMHYLDMLRAAGFRDAKMVSFTGYRTAPTTIGAIFRARKPSASV